MAALPVLALGLVGWALAPTLAIVLVALAPLSLALGTLNTVVNSVLSRSAPSEQFGGILGLSASVFSLAQLIAPTGGGLLLEVLGTASPGLVAAGIVTLLTPSPSPLVPPIAKSALVEPHAPPHGAGKGWGHPA